jgi:DNA-binding MarR family transcriptional regulator
LERVIHEKTRLAILTALAANGSLTFNELKSILKTTSGNVSVHAKKLEMAKYIETRKTFEGRIPRTEYAITPTGQRAFDRYLKQMEALIKASRG